ncbi:unnamed protein product [Anisakis simplex]|uniref:C-type lectin domain-containing protein n=1 Tax=Anisakis simplex TaxID=6269 RepID=A0A0M3JQY4_ANISI|nr:unnamed protein product [Anisakis simplex]
MTLHILLALFATFYGTSADCGTPASLLEEKCLAYPSLSYFTNGLCYILELRQPRSVDEVKADKSSNYANICQHLNGYRASLAVVDEVVKYQLKAVGLLTESRYTITENQFFATQIDTTQKYSYLCRYETNSEDEFKCPEGYALRGLYCYKINVNPMTHNDAEMACRRMNGSLAVLHDEETGQFIANLAIREGVNARNVHIGLRWNEQIKQWSNSDATSVDFFRWLNKEEGMSLCIGIVTMSGTLQQTTEGVLNVQVTNEYGVGTYGYMDIAESNRRSVCLCGICCDNPT